MNNKILLGYETGTGNRVDIPLSHLIVTGITHLSGKSTTLEALLKRSGKKAIVFKTKIGEKEFNEGTEIAPFFRDRSDYAFVRSLIEAYAREKLSLEKGTLMQLCKGANSILEIKQRVDAAISKGGLRGIKEEIYTRLQNYLENLYPQIRDAKLSKTLNLVEGVNIVNLGQFTKEVQSLIIEATVMEVLVKSTDTIIVIPEAWKFLPQKYSNPCKRSVEEFVRQGATNNNFLWIDSQDMAGVDKTPLKQISVYILGVQQERNEVKHTLDEIPLPSNQKPSADEVMTLRIGQFFVSTYSEPMRKVYVQPAWMDEEMATKIAKGELSVEEIIKPITSTTSHKGGLVGRIFDREIVDEEEIIKKVLERLPKPIDKEELISEILSQILAKKVAVYKIAPLEMIQKEFLLETKDKILESITKLNADQRKIIKFIESVGKGVNVTELVSRCFFLSPTSGGSRQKILNFCKELEAQQFLRKDNNNNIMYPNLKEKIKDALQYHGAVEPEVEQVYQHVIKEMLEHEK